MTLPSDDLLLRALRRLPGVPESDVRSRIEAGGELYRAELVIALDLLGWAGPEPPADEVDQDSPDFDAGWCQAMREVADHLLAGDFIPGGVHFDDQVAALSDQTRRHTAPRAGRHRGQPPISKGPA